MNLLTLSINLITIKVLFLFSSHKKLYELVLT